MPPRPPASPQEAPKRPPEAPKTPPRCPKRPQRGSKMQPRGPREASQETPTRLYKDENAVGVLWPCRMLPGLWPGRALSACSEAAVAIQHCRPAPCLILSPKPTHPHRRKRGRRPNRRRRRHPSQGEGKGGRGCPPSADATTLSADVCAAPSAWGSTTLYLGGGARAPHAQKTPSSGHRVGTPSRHTQDPAPRQPGGQGWREKRKTPLPRKHRFQRLPPARFPPRPARSLPPATAQ